MIVAITILIEYANICMQWHNKKKTQPFAQNAITKDALMLQTKFSFRLTNVGFGLGNY